MVVDNLFIGLTMSDLSTQNWGALYYKRQTLFHIKYIKNPLQITPIATA